MCIALPSHFHSRLANSTKVGCSRLYFENYLSSAKTNFQISRLASTVNVTTRQDNNPNNNAHTHTHGMHVSCLLTDKVSRLRLRRLPATVEREFDLTADTDVDASIDETPPRDEAGTLVATESAECGLILPDKHGTTTIVFEIPIPLLGRITFGNFFTEESGVCLFDASIACREQTSYVH
jgi:hypothetical protein